MQLQRSQGKAWVHTHLRQVNLTCRTRLNSAASRRGTATVCDIDEHLSKLNAEQLEAVTCEDRAIRVKAGPGSGKTRVLVTRSAWLVHQGVAPEEIMAITFTNKAADELQERVEDMVGSVDAKKMETGTFHAVGNKILRKHVGMLGTDLKRDYVIITDNSKLDKIMASAMLDLPEFAPMLLTLRNANAVAKAIMRAVHRVKDLVDTSYNNPRMGLLMLQELKDLPRLTAQHNPNKTNEPPQVFAGVNMAPIMTADFMNRLFHHYHAALRRRNCVDCNDLIGLTVHLLKTHPDVRSMYQDKIQHVLVDEFQDTNAGQYAFVKQLVGDQGNLFVVGDDDQAIYMWRQADPKNMTIELPMDYPDLRTFILTKTYRSGTFIVKSADGMRRHMGSTPLHLHMRATRTNFPGVVQHYLVDNDGIEAELIAQHILARRAQGVPWHEIAILMRKNHLRVKVERKLVSAGIPCVFLGDKQLWETMVGRDVLDYFTWALNIYDDKAADEVVETPARGVADKGQEKLGTEARCRATTWSAMCFADLQDVHMSRGQLDTVMSAIKNLTPQFVTDNTPAGVRQALKKIGEQGVAAQIVKDLFKGSQTVNIASAEQVLTKAGVPKFRQSSWYRGLDEMRAMVVLMRGAARLGDLMAVLDIMKVLGRYDAMIHHKESCQMDWAKVRSELARFLKKISATPRQDLPQASYTDMPELAMFLDEVALQQLQYRNKKLRSAGKNEHTDKVQLMTIHKSKGLEFDTVFLMGLEDGNLPSSTPTSRNNMSARPVNEQEEVNLCYVAVTRAKNALFMTTALEREEYGSRRQYKPSPFLDTLRAQGVTTQYWNGSNRSGGNGGGVI